MSEFVLPVKDCPLYPALLDINMMGKFPSFPEAHRVPNTKLVSPIRRDRVLTVSSPAVLNGMERTEAQFTKLLDAAGLQVVKFWSVGAETEALVEAILKD